LDARRSHVRLAAPARRRFEDRLRPRAALARFRHIRPPEEQQQ
jgi:hypothetical protein